MGEGYAFLLVLLVVAVLAAIRVVATLWSDYFALRKSPPEGRS